MSDSGFRIDLDLAGDLSPGVEEGRWKVTEQLARLDATSAARAAGVRDAAAAITDFGVGLREFLTELADRLADDEARLRHCVNGYCTAEDGAGRRADGLGAQLSPLPGKL